MTGVSLSINEVKKVAIEAALAAGHVLRRRFYEGRTKIASKRDGSIQTAADVEAECTIVQAIRAAFPDHRIDSEESGLLEGSQTRYEWLVDPLDGTENFVSGIPYFSVSIALCEDRLPLAGVVYDPITERLYTGLKNFGATLNENAIAPSETSELKNVRVFFVPDFETKRSHLAVGLLNKLRGSCRRVLDTWSPALDWALLASGKADALLVIGSRPMRPNAGTLIATEAKCIITDFGGKDFGLGDEICFLASGDRNCHQQLLDLIAQSVSK